ncbi:MAG: hypothetical protein WB821_04395 [Burkholderiaceae bacterium]
MQGISFWPAGRWLCMLAATAASPVAQAWVLGITPGTRAVYLAVGNATANTDNATVNLVSLAVPAAAALSGAAQAMTSNSTQAVSPFDNFTVCTPATGQVYIGGFYRLPATNATTAVLQVSTPAGLTSGANSIPFSQISWTSTSIGNNGAADIPAGTFVSGGTLLLRNFAANSYVENCHTFNYTNASLVAAGVYNGLATYTLTAP